MSLNALWSYLIIFFWIIGTGCGLPIPEEIPIVTGGVWVARENSDAVWWIMLPVCILGVVIGDLALYFIGKRWGHRLVKSPWVKHNLLPEEKRLKIEQNYRDYGIRILLFARMLPGIRTPIFMMAGVLHMSLRKFIIADAIYAIPGVNLFFWLGYWFTDAFVGAINRISHYRDMVMVAILAGVAGYLVFAFQKRKISTGDPASIPVIGPQLGHIAHDQHMKSALDTPALPVAEPTKPLDPDELLPTPTVPPTAPTR